MNATAGPDGVLIQWRTSFELNNLGFNVYRVRNGERVQLNRGIIGGSALVVGQGTPMYAGSSYSWFDAEGTSDSEYYVEDVDLGDKHTQHEAVKPVWSAKPQRPAVLPFANSGLSRQAAEQEWSGSAPAQSPESFTTAIENQWAIAALPAGQVLKIAVKSAGWYRVTQPQLAAAGFDVSTARDSQNLRMFVYGIEKPIRVSRNSGLLTSADYVEFYGFGLDVQTTDTQVYYLVNGTQPGLRIMRAGGPVPSGKPVQLSSGSSLSKDSSQATRTDRRRNHAVATAAAAAPNFASTVQRKDRKYYFTKPLNGDTENFFGDVLSPTSHPLQTLTVSDFEPTAAGPAQLRVAVEGISEQTHLVNVFFNGTQVGSISFFGISNVVQTFPVPVSSLIEGTNSVDLVPSAPPQGGTSDVNFADYTQITYPHSFKARNDSLRFSIRYNQSARIDGFNCANARCTNILILDITDPTAVLEVRPLVEPSGPAYALTVLAAGPKKGMRTLLALTAVGAAVNASALTLNQPSSWNLSTNAADLVIISHQNFIASLAPLVSQRQAQGFTVAVVNIEDLFDEFSYGLHTPQAITDFLARARGGPGTGWSLPPRYLLLVGDASYDYRNYMGFGDLDFVPTKLIDATFMETASDDVLADLNDDGIADTPVGRLPARTAAEASLMVSKIVTFSPANPPNTAMLVADAQGNYYFNFEQANDDVAAILLSRDPSITIQKVYRAQIGDAAARNAILNNFNAGLKLVHYSGHGNVDIWGGGMFNATDARNLTNGNKLPLVVVMDCLNGYFDDPAVEGIAEALLKAPNGGSVASFASSGLTIPDGQHQMANSLYNLVWGSQPIAIGDAVIQAKTATSDIDVRRTWILLGDPTLKIR